MSVTVLDAALQEYLVACYGDPRKIGRQQLKEVSQAFLSGIHWRDCEPTMMPGSCGDAIRQMLGIEKDRN